MNCPYCLNQAEWVENKEIYKRNYGKSYMVYLCRKCDAYVGCHNNSRKPLGIMANKETRDWRMKAHKVFDPLWKSGKIKRERAYGFLQRRLGYKVHIAESDIDRCKAIIDACQNDKWFEELLKTKGASVISYSEPVR